MSLHPSPCKRGSCYDPRPRSPFRFRLFRRLLVGRFSYCEVSCMSLHTVILRDNRIQHIMPKTAFDNLRRVKDSDKTLRIWLRSQNWITRQLDAEKVMP